MIFFKNDGFGQSRRLLNAKNMKQITLHRGMKLWYQIIGTKKNYSNNLKIR